MEEIRVKMLSQKDFNEVHDQNMGHIESTDPHALQQYGEAEGNALDIRRGV